MNVLVVRPMLFQVRALMTQNVSVFGACIWDKTQDPSITPKLLEENKDVTWLSCYPDGSMIRSIIKKTVFFAQIFNQNKIDVVQVNGLRDLPAVYWGRLFSKVKPRIVVISHNPEIWKDKKQVKRNTNFIKRFSDGVITLSTKNYDLLRNQGMQPDRMRFIPNAFLGTNTNYSGIKQSVGESMLFYPASVIPRKNQLLLLKIVKQLKERHNISVFIAGDLNADPQYVNSLNEYTRQNGLDDQVHLLGKIPYSEVLSYFSRCDLVVFPTRSEMMPRAVIEAMWLGKPVISSAVDGILDLISDHETGILVDSEDVDGFSRAVSELVEDPEKALRLAVNGQKFVREFCSLENVGKLMVNFYEQIRCQNGNESALSTF